MIKRQYSQQGFNIIELIIVIVVLGILASVAGPMIYQMSNAMITGTELQNISAKSRLSFERMERELRLIKSNSSSDLNIATNSITFTKLNNQSVTYTLSGTNLMRNSQILISDVTSLQFTYYTSAGAVTTTGSSVRFIKIQVTIAQNSHSTTLGAIVFPRNIS